MSNPDIDIVISAPTNRKKIELPYASKIKLILDRLAQLVYGKPIAQCLGKAQNVLVSTLKGKRIQVILPENDEPLQSQVATDVAAIKNIVKHVQNKDIDIFINW